MTPIFSPIRQRRRAWLTLAALAVLVLPSCKGDGNFSVLGYSTRPNYDPNIHTVRLTIFKNNTFYRGLEFELARALETEIEQHTPFKIVGVDQCADTELTGTIISYTKNIINRNQLNEVREAQTVMAVEVVWKDLRTGEILSRAVRGAPLPMPAIQPGLDNLPPGPGPLLAGSPLPGSPPPGTPPPGTPQPIVVPVPGAPPPPLPGVVITSLGGFIPELGQSFATAEQENTARVARHIREMMEAPW